MSDHPHDHGHDHGDEPLTLEERHEHERDFYDEWAIDEFAEAPDEVLNVDGSVIPFPNQQHVDFLTYAIDQIRPIEGKKILEAGTGNRPPGGVVRAERRRDDRFRRVAGHPRGGEASGEGQRRRRERTRFIEGSAEYLDEPDDTYDVIFGNQVAHHFDLALAGPGTSSGC